MLARHNYASAILLAALCCGGTAAAGGYDTGERDWSLLFDQGRFATEAGVRHIMPQRTLSNINGVFGPSANVREGDATTLAHARANVALGEHAACMASIYEPYAGHATYGTGWTYAVSAIEQHFSSRDIGVTCRGAVDAGKGRLHIIGGVSYQSIDYELVRAAAPAGLATAKVSDDGVAWRIGAAFDIPEYALRVSLIYNSAVDYAMGGTLTTAAGSLPISGNLAMPQSVELNAQSGVAPGWLVFGAVKWTDWSVVQSMALCPTGVPVCNQATAVSGLTLLWKDTWTVTAGAAHQFNDTVAVAASFTWDQGATQGFTSQTDTWVFGTNVVVSPNEAVELTLGGTIGVMTGGALDTTRLQGGIPNPVGYTAQFGTDMVYTVSAKGRVRF
ncbi:MAG: outer membrane protein transport protein [Roseitalea sp.]|jgi:long-chain fatty acid transport protein|nr:outer membrane protein transport protein [Roseitalea sp.]MBO6720405.1 outer membrane protein transport protein [Roseitalea sp.]MBO6742765.1 outer membrane protein transport protein [Roseitalea sp.]